MKLVILTVVLFGTVCSQLVFQDRTCMTPFVRAQQRFDINKFLGTWYEIQRYKEKNQVGGICIKMNYELPSPRSNITVETKMLTFDTWNMTSSKGKVWHTNMYHSTTNYLPPTSVEGRLTVSVTGVESDANDIVILKTDYKGYAIAWSCQPSNSENDLRRYESAWVLGRAPALTEKQRQDVEKYLDKPFSPINKRNLKPTNQDKCVCG